MLYTATAQTPNKFNYQVVVRTSTGAIVANGANIAFRISILDGSTTGTVLYSERITHTVSNSHGIANLEIGGGSLISGAWPTQAQWATGTKFLKVDIDINGASTYVDVSNTQLLSVPYAQYAAGANTASNLLGTATINPSQILPQGATVGQILKWNGTAWVASTDSVNTGDITEITTGTGITGGGTDGNITIAADNTNAIWNANKLQGNDLDATAPTTGQVIMWDGTKWIPTNEKVNTAGTGLSITNGVINSTWTQTGNNVANNNTGNLGIGTGATAPTATLSVNEKFKVTGATGALTLTDANGVIQFPNSTATGNASIYQYLTGTQNNDRYMLSHSPSFKNWGLMYSDSFDRYEYQAGGKQFTAMAIDLTNQRAVVGKRSTNDKFEVYDGSFSTVSAITSMNTTGSAALKLNANNGLLDLKRYAQGSTAVIDGIGSSNLGVLKNNTGSLYVGSTDSIMFGTNGSRAMTISKDGYVGIGTNKPLTMLHLKSNQDWMGEIDFVNNGYISFHNKNTYIGYLGNYTDTFGMEIGTSGSGTKMHLTTAATPRLTVSGSNVGIGTVDPTSTLDVNGLARIRGGSPGTNKVLTSTNNNGDATWTASNALPGTIALTGFRSGYVGANVPAGSAGLYEFMGGITQSVTLTANQRLVITASVTLGRSTTGIASSGFRMDVGYQLGSGTINNCSSGGYMIVTPAVSTAGAKDVYSFTGTVKPGAGTYNIGIVINNGVAGQVGFFNNNDYCNITYQIINE